MLRMLIEESLGVRSSLQKAARALSALIPRGLSEEALELTGGSVTCPRIRSPEEGAEDVGNGVVEKFYQALLSPHI